jgi:tetratricopeptide (TPR) repeat protein
VNGPRARNGWLVLALAALLTAVAVRTADAASDTRELRAREAFAAGRFQDALDLFAKLYAETLHPIYLRNIGRCYQNMGNPDKALISFRDYLRKAKNLTPDEEKEIQGYIKEMEELQKKHEAAATPPPPPSGSGSVTPIAPPPTTPTSNTATVQLTAPPPQAPQESPAVYERWWFWAIVGGVVVAGLGIAFATGAFTKTEEPTCPTGTFCGQ